MYNAHNGVLIWTFQEHEEEVRSAIFVNNDENILTAGVDKRLILWTL